jgi:hypothetical protein
VAAVQLYCSCVLPVDISAFVPGNPLWLTGVDAPITKKYILNA